MRPCLKTNKTKETKPETQAKTAKLPSKQTNRKKTQHPLATMRMYGTLQTVPRWAEGGLENSLQFF